MTARGFSLLEITIAVLVLGLTVTALLQMFEWSHIRYREFTSDWKFNAALSESRIWIRDKVMSSAIDELTPLNLAAAVNLPLHFYVAELRVTNYNENTYFVRIGLFEDRNRNGMPDADETEYRLLCFRRRSI